MAENKDINLSENALRVLERRYLVRDMENRVTESPEEMFRRVARNIAQVDEDPDGAERDFYRMMTSLEFLPNSPTLMNAGSELGQLSACFVLPVEDSMESIFESIKYTALIHKSGGGTGFSFSRLRPKGSSVASTGGISSGPVSFMKVFDTATDVIKQGGKRRGANMAILRVDHPDIKEFIFAKEDPSRFNNFNLSVALTDAFMRALEKDGEYELVDPNSQQIRGRAKAREIFEDIVHLAWENGDPGIIFLDRINRDNPTPHLGEIEGTNPCGEQPLLPYESCNLGSINLATMVSGNDGQCQLDYEKLKGIVHLAVRFLDNVIDVNHFPLPIIEEKTKGNRKIGLGVMGFADLLIRLGIPYNSDEALSLASDLMKFIQNETWKASSILARLRGPFPNFKKSKFDVADGSTYRNATTTTIAPTGTLSIIAGCSSGIEPLFAISYLRKAMDDETLTEIHPYFLDVAKKRGFYRESLMKAIAEKGSIQEMSEIPQDVRRIFVTAHDITPEWHVKIQAAFQSSTDNAVSKTVNFPWDALPEEIERVYLLAYNLGCKGVTIYRDRSRDEQVLNITAGGDLVQPVAERPSELQKATIPYIETSSHSEVVPRPRPSITRGLTERISTGCGKLYITVNYDDEGICEVFAQMGKTGGCAASQIEGISRLISLALRSRMKVESIIKQIKGIRCPSPLWGRGGMTLSCADAISKVLEKQINRPVVAIANVVGACPDCGGAVEHVEGCVVCRFCGFTKCG
jgi:ribonucleoside-diphosphate reductase alpha chain